MEKWIIIVIAIVVIFVAYKLYYKPEGFEQIVGGEEELKYIPPNSQNLESAGRCHYVDGETQILTAGEQMNVELMKTMQHPWENLNKVEETPAGKISTFYFLDNYNNLKFGAGCCHPPKVGEQTDMVQSRYFGSNTSGDSGCLCMSQDLASSLAHRAGNI